jgi:hypothetical protein
MTTVTATITDLNFEDLFAWINSKSFEEVQFAGWGTRSRPSDAALRKTLFDSFSGRYTGTIELEIANDVDAVYCQLAFGGAQ